MFQRIVIPIDLYKDYDWSELIFQLFNMVASKKTSFYIIYVVPEFGVNLFDEHLSHEWLKQKEHEATIAINELIVKFFPQEFTVEQHIAHGIVVEEVVKYANEVKADLIALTCAKNSVNDQNSHNTKKMISQTNKSVMIFRYEPCKQLQ